MADEANMNDMFKENEEAIEAFSNQIDDLQSHMSHLARDYEGTGRAAEVMRDQMGAVSDALADQKSKLDSSTSVGKKYIKEISKLESELSDLRSGLKSNSDATVKYAKKIEGLGRKSKKRIKDLYDEIKAYAEHNKKLEESSKLSYQISKASNIAASSFSNLSGELNKYKKGLPDAAGKTALMTGATVLLGNTIGETANKIREAIKDLNAYQVQLTATSQISLASPTGVSGLEELRSAVGTTRTEFSQFLPDLKEVSKVGIDTSNLTKAAENVVKMYGEGSEAQKALKEYADILKQMPSLAQDFSFQATSDDRSAALFALAEQGNVEVGIKAGLFGGIEATSEAAGVQTDIQKSIRVQEDIRNQVKNVLKNTSSMLPIMSEIGQYSKVVNSLLGTTIFGAISGFGATAVAQRSTTNALLGAQVTATGKLGKMGNWAKNKLGTKELSSFASKITKGIGNVVKSIGGKIKGVGAAVRTGVGAFMGGGGTAAGGAASGGTSIVSTLGPLAAKAGAVGAGFAIIGAEIYATVKEWDNIQNSLRETSPILNSLGSVVGTSTEKIKDFSNSLDKGTYIEEQINQMDTAMGVMSGDIGSYTKSLGHSFGEMKLSMGRTVGAFAGGGALIGSVIPGVGTALGAIAGTAVGAAVAVGKWVAQTNELRKAEKEAAEKAIEQQTELAHAFGYDEIEGFRDGLESLNKKIKDAEEEMTGNAESALLLQQSLKSLDAAAKSPIIRLHELGAESAKANIEMQRAIGGSTKAYLDNARSVNQSLGKVLFKRVKETDKIMARTFGNLNKKDPAAFSMALAKSQKIIANETSKFVSEMENVIESLSRTPTMLAAEMEGQAAGAMIQVGDAMMTGLTIDSSVATFKTQSAAIITRMEEAGSVASERMLLAAKSIQTVRDAFEKNERTINRANASFADLPSEIKKLFGESAPEQRETFKNVMTEEGRENMDPDALAELNASLKTAADTANKTQMEQAAKVKALEKVYSVFSASTQEGISTDEEISFAQKRLKIAEEELELAKLKRKEEEGGLSAEQQRRKGVLEGKTETGTKREQEAREELRGDMGIAESQVERENIVEQAQKDVDVLRQSKGKVLDILQGIHQMELGEEFGREAEKYAEWLTNQIEQGNVDTEEALAKMTETFKGSRVPEEIGKRVEAAMQENEQAKKEASAVQAAMLRTSNTINKNAKMTRLQNKAIFEAQNTFLNIVSEGTKNMVSMIQRESTNVKAAAADVRTIKALDTAGVGVAYQLIGERIRRDVKLMSESYTDVQKRLSEANNYAADFASSIGEGVISKEEVKSKLEADENISEDVKESVFKALDKMVATDFDAKQIQDIFEKVNLAEALERQLKTVSEVVKSLEIGFEGTDIGKATQRATSSVEEMIELARVGFVDLKTQAQTGVGVAKEAMESEIEFQKQRVSGAKEARTELKKQEQFLRKALAAETDPQKRAEIEEEMRNIAKQRKGVIANINAIEIEATNKVRAAELRFEKQRLKMIFSGLEIEKRKAEINEEMASTQLGVLEQIGAPYASILEKQAEIVSETKKQAEFETAKYKEMKARLGDSVEVREQELRMVKAQAKVAEKTIQAQRSAMEKLLGSAIGELGGIGGFKRNLLAQQKGTGLTVGPGGIALGGEGTAKTKSEQAAAIQAGSMVKSAMGNAMQKPSKNIKEATDKARESTDKNTEVVKESTEKAKASTDKNTEAVKENSESTSSLSDTINGITDYLSPRPQNVNIPNQEAGEMRQEGVSDQRQKGLAQDLLSSFTNRVSSGITNLLGLGSSNKQATASDSTTTGGGERRSREDSNRSRRATRTDSNEIEQSLKQSLKKQAEFETAKYKEMKARLGDSVEVREQELRMNNAQAKVNEKDEDELSWDRAKSEPKVGATSEEVADAGGSEIGKTKIMSELGAARAAHTELNEIEQSLKQSLAEETDPEEQIKLTRQLLNLHKNRAKNEENLRNSQKQYRSLKAEERSEVDVTPEQARTDETEAELAYIEKRMDEQLDIIGDMRKLQSLGKGKKRRLTSEFNNRGVIIQRERGRALKEAEKELDSMKERGIDVDNTYSVSSPNIPLSESIPKEVNERYDNKMKALRMEYNRAVGFSEEGAIEEAEKRLDQFQKRFDELLQQRTRNRIAQRRANTERLFANADKRQQEKYFGTESAQRERKSSAQEEKPEERSEQRENKLFDWRERADAREKRRTSAQEEKSKVADKIHRGMVQSEVSRLSVGRWESMKELKEAANVKDPENKEQREAKEKANFVLSRLKDVTHSLDFQQELNQRTKAALATEPGTGTKPQTPAKPSTPVNPRHRPPQSVSAPSAEMAGFERIDSPITRQEEVRSEQPVLPPEQPRVKSSAELMKEALGLEPKGEGPDKEDKDTEREEEKKEKEFEQLTEVNKELDIIRDKLGKAGELYEVFEKMQISLKNISDNMG